MHSIPARPTSFILEPLAHFPPETPRRCIRVVAALVFATCPHAAIADLAACAAIDDDAARLACYDAQSGVPRVPKPPRASSVTTPPAAAPVTPTPSPSSAASPAGSTQWPRLADVPGATPPSSDLDQRWELSAATKQGAFRLLPYRPLYALVHGTSNTNNAPSSPTRSVAIEDIHLDRLEAKLQLSFRTKLVQEMFGTPADLWFGYTQQSYWQAANSRYSSPFRETNYEPEAIAIYPLHLSAAGVSARYAGLSFTHQSNGRGESLSRSWNRLIGEVALESGPWALHVRPWLRVLESAGERDDNPDIQDYVGRGEVVLVHRAGRHSITFTGRHTLRGGERSRGSGQLDWAFPLSGSLDGHLQIFSGYGESLIDYNHRQTSIGLGVSFFD
jgi:phospholipase A1